MSELKLSSPWVTYKNEIKAMFEGDPNIRIQYDEDKYEIRLYVDKQSKYDALEKILKHEQTFGNVTLKITVIPPNDVDILDVFDDAFVGNEALQYTLPIESPLGTHRFVVFKNEVVQFFNDQLDDLNGNKSTLFQEIAKDIFVDDLAVNYCTEAEPCLRKPLGEWP